MKDEKDKQQTQVSANEDVQTEKQNTANNLKTATDRSQTSSDEDEGYDIVESGLGIDE